MSDTTPHKRLLVLTFGTFVMGTGNLVFTGVLGELAGDLGVSEGSAGLLVTIYAVVVIVGSPILVSLTGTVARKRLLLGTVLLYGVTNAVAAILPTFELLVFDRAIIAVGAAIFVPVAVSVAAALAPAGKKGQAIGLVVAGSAGSFVVGLPLGTLIGGYGGWRATFAFVGSIALLAFIGLWVFLPSVEATDSTVGLQALQVIRRPAVIVNIGLITTAFTSVFVGVTFIGPLLRNITGFGNTGVSLLQLLLGVGGIGGATVGGYGSDHWNTTKMLLGIFVGVILGIFPFWLLAPVAGSIGAIVGAIAALMIGASAVFALIPTQQNRLLQAAPESREVVLALTLSGQFLGIALGSAIGSVTLTVLDSYASLGLVGALIGVGGLGAVSYLYVTGDRMVMPRSSDA
ncbi:MFS transporter [Halocatena marina]|uniref:MFS transporter n=1 Tax=Halocatena marina TaxID=2934937 RepID=UPI00200BB9DD|nr:MFS transporter [Halocatena marina]